jgi:hypothetical protein
VDGPDGCARPRPGLTTAHRRIFGKDSPSIDVKLTADEIRLIVFVLLALLVGAAVKHYRHGRPVELPPPPAHASPAPKAPVDYE